MAWKLTRVQLKIGDYSGLILTCSEADNQPISAANVGKLPKWNKTFPHLCNYIYIVGSLTAMFIAISHAITRVVASH